jgi:hypothetical protein
MTRSGETARRLLGGPDAELIHVFDDPSAAREWESRVPGARTVAPARGGWRGLSRELRERKHRVRDQSLKIVCEFGAQPATTDAVGEIAVLLHRLGAYRVVVGPLSSSIQGIPVTR